MKSKKKKNFEWKQKFLRRQAKINAFARKHLCPGGNDNAFVVMHPDEYYRFLHRGPCPDCPVRHFCDTPCTTYINWYDQRMGLFRAGLRLGEGYE